MATFETMNECFTEEEFTLRNELDHEEQLKLIALIEVEYTTQTIQRSFCKQTSKRGYRVNIDQTWLHLCEKVIKKNLRTLPKIFQKWPSFPLRRKYSYLVVIAHVILLKKD